MEATAIAVPFFTALVLSLAGTPVLIRVLRKIKAGQSIREEGPQSHMSKSGTPTMGGIAMIFAAIVGSVVTGATDRSLWIVLAAFLAFGALGFADDFVKVSRKRNLGLTAKQKLALQILFAAALAIYQVKVSPYGTSVLIPFTDGYLDLGIFYVPFLTFVVVAMANSVNLTDGLDGLATGVTLLVSAFFATAAIAFGSIAGTSFSMALVGACIGFLVFNRYPAKVFMGDTGSMALGGGLAALAIILHIELILPIAGGIYVAEAVSVILQVVYFKKTGGKRLFKMAPLHHHFEESGWKEQKVVVVFWVITLGLCLLSHLAL